MPTFYGRSAQDLTIRLETGAPLQEQSGPNLTEEPLVFIGRAARDLVLRMENGVPVFEQDGITPINLEP